MNKLLKITETPTLPNSSQQFLNYRRYQFQILISQTKNLNEDGVNISRPYLLYFPRNSPLKSVTVHISSLPEKSYILRFLRFIPVQQLDCKCYIVCLFIYLSNTTHIEVSFGCSSLFVSQFELIIQEYIERYRVGWNDFQLFSQISLGKMQKLSTHANKIILKYFCNRFISSLAVFALNINIFDVEN